MTFKVKDGLSVGANTIIDSSGNLTPNGKTTLSNTTAAGASLNLGTGTADPSSPATGDVWNNTGVLKIRQAAATKTVAYLDSTITGNAANVTGTVAIANGGTNGSATPTAGAVPYGTGTSFGFTAAGTSGQYLTSAGTGIPVWVTLPTTIANATNVGITNETASASAHYLHFGALTTGNGPVKVSSTRLTFVPSTGNLTTSGSVGVGGNGVIFSGSTSGTTTVKASAAAGTTTLTLPAVNGNVVTTGDTGTVTSTMIADGTIANIDINASAAIAVSKLAANTISNVTLGGTLFGLTLGTGLVGTSYNGSAAVTTGLAASGVTAATYGSSTAIPVIAVDATGRITSASNSNVTIGEGTLGAASAANTGATATTVAINFSAAYNANTSSNVTINPVIGPSLSALATVMTGASTGVLSKSAADTYTLVTNIATATTLQTARTIQGVSFNGSANITVATGGTGVTVTGTSIAIGQAVATSSNVQFQAIGVGAANTVAGTITATSFNSITGLSLTATAPIVAGTATGGTSTLVSRQDHVHPVQTTVSGNAGSVTNGVYTNATNTFTGTNAFNGTGIHSFGNVSGLFTGYFTLGGRAVRKATTGSAIEIVDAAGTTVTHTFGDAGTLAVTGAITGSSFNSITGLSSTTPLVAGAAAIGTGTTAARDDHVHPVQTTVSGNAGTVTNGVYTNVANTLSGKVTVNAGTTADDRLTLFSSAAAQTTLRLYQSGVAEWFVGMSSGSSIFRIGPSSGVTTTSLQLDTSGNLTATGNVTAYSDIRLKKDLVQIPNALDKVQQLTGYTYTRIDTGEKQTGLVAQDVQKVLPEAVVEGEHLSLAYGNLVGLLVEAIKELNSKVDSLEEKLKRN